MSEKNVNQPTPEQIAVCAYSIWEKEGRPQGRDADHWAQAERELQAKCAATPGASRSATSSPLSRSSTRKNSKRQEVAAV